MNELTVVEWAIGICAPYLCCFGSLFLVGGVMTFVGSRRRGGGMLI